jgi:hypothetical protein
MLQPDETLPAVPRVPAPWTLQGHAWMVALRLPPGDPARTAFLPADLQASLQSAVSVLMCVAYDSAPCGPYRELLFIPGTAQFGQGRYPTISRILVSTWDSVVNGRRNWGIPKDQASFDWSQADGNDHWRVSSDGREVCTLQFTPPVGPRLPLRSRWVPGAIGTVAQRLAGSTYYVRPEARGWMRMCRLRQVRCNDALFPDLGRATVLAALRIEDFRMVFPVARVDP